MKNRFIFPIFLILSLIFVSGCVSQLGSFTVVVKDAVTGEGVADVKVLFYYSCPLTKQEIERGESVGSSGDPTCGGLYEKLEDGKTDKDGKFVFTLSQKTVPITDLDFTLEKEGYDTGERGFGFFGYFDSKGNWVSIVKRELTIKIIPDSAPVNKEKALAIAESDEKVKTWSAKFKFINKNIEMVDGKWEMYFSAPEVFGAHISMLIDPKDGKISSYEESDGGYEYIKIASQTPETKKFLQKYPNASISVDESGSLAVDYRIDYFDLKGYCDKDCYYPDPYLRLRIFIEFNKPGKMFVECYNEQKPPKERFVEENVLKYLENESCLS